MTRVNIYTMDGGLKDLLQEMVKYQDCVNLLPDGPTKTNLEDIIVNKYCDLQMHEIETLVTVLNDLEIQRHAYSDYEIEVYCSTDLRLALQEELERREQDLEDSEE